MLIIDIDHFDCWNASFGILFVAVVYQPCLPVFILFLVHIYASATHYKAMMVGDPCPMHKRFHTILGLPRTLFCPAYTMAGTIHRIIII